MIKNYIKIAWRNILKDKILSFINIFGLAAGMSVCMLIILMWVDQKSYDSFHSNKDRIYRIVTSPLENNRMRATIPFPTTDALKNELPVLESAAFIRSDFGGDAVFKTPDNQYKYAEMRGYFSTPAFLEMFDFNLEKGDKNTALTATNSIVLSKAMATQLFGNVDPLGKSVQFFDRGLNFFTDEGYAPVDWGYFTVTGVFEEQAKSHLKFDVMASAASLDLLYTQSKIDDLRNNWSIDHKTYSYVLLKDGASEKALETGLASLTEHHLANSNNDYLKGMRFTYQPLTEITPGAATGNSTDTTLPLFSYYILGGLALIILLASCLNYTSLSVARALTRSNEIGVRKVNGAAKRDLIFQFVTEAFIIVLGALVLANLLLLFLKKAFLNLWLNQFLNFDLNFNLKVYASILVFTLLVGFLAGVYPAVRMASFDPIKSLKKLEFAGSGKLGLRRVLIVSQFVISLFFVISGILVYKQLNQFMQFDYGFNPKNVINVNLQSNDYKLIKQAISEIPGVEAVSACAYVPADGRSDNTGINKPGEEQKKSAIGLSVDRNFTEVMDIKLLAGQIFPSTTDNSSEFVMVNETASRELGYERTAEIVGQTLEVGGQKKTVAGVFENFNFFLVFSGRQTGPIVFNYNPSLYKYATIRISGTKPEETLARIQTAWQKIDPIHPLLYEYYDDQLADNNQGVIDLVSIIGFLAFMAILIACLGLFGMATYSIERRTKEIGVRKVLGASIMSLNYTLSKEFLKMIGIAVLIAAPAAYFLNNLWLNYMITRAEFGLGIVWMGTFIVVMLALLTVIPQSIRVASKNPVETLKIE